MNHVDRHLALRFVSNMVGVVFVFFCLIALGESLDSWRLGELARTRGTEIALLSIVANSARWSIRALPVTALISGILTLINLQRQSTLVVLKAGGLSIWQIIRGPAIAMLLIGTVIAFFGDTEVTKLARFIEPAPQVAGSSVGQDGEIWIEQVYGGKRFIISADHALPGATALADVVVFMGQDYDLRRVLAARAELTPGLWVFSDARLISATGPGELLDTFLLETDSTVADLRLRLTSTNDLTAFELAESIRAGLSDASLRAAAATRLSRLMAVPVLLVGTLLIAFAFTAGYRRGGSYGGTVLYGIVLGFGVFVVNEMSERAGSAGVLAPSIAAWGPAIVAIVIGLTVLLYKEDGRA